MTVWNNVLRNGNPFRSDLVTKYLAFTREKQKQERVSAKQALVLLQSNLVVVIAPKIFKLQGYVDPFVRATLALDIAIFTVAFCTTKRGEEATRTFIQRILRLPNYSGLLFNSQWEKTLRKRWGRSPTDGSVFRGLCRDLFPQGSRAVHRSWYVYGLGYDDRVLILHNTTRDTGERKTDQGKSPPFSSTNVSKLKTVRQKGRRERFLHAFLSLR